MAPRWALAAAATLAGAARWAAAAEVGPSADSVALLQHSVGRERSLVSEAPVVDGPAPTYLLGDGAEVFIETGQFMNTWVPCTITKINANGWYDIRVPAGIKGHNHTDSSAIRYNYLRQVTPEAYDKSLEAFEGNDDKVALAAQVDRESNRRKRAQDALKRARDYAKQVMSKGCPGEYIIMEGNIPNGDHFGRGSRMLQSSVELCAKDCDAQAACKAFEWDPISTICQLKKQSEPKPHFSDARYMLCQRFIFEGSSNTTSSATEMSPAASTSPTTESSPAAITSPAAETSPATETSPVAETSPATETSPVAETRSATTMSPAAEMESQLGGADAAPVEAPPSEPIETLSQPVETASQPVEVPNQPAAAGASDTEKA